MWRLKRLSTKDASELTLARLSDFPPLITLYKGIVRFLATLPNVSSSHDRFWVASLFQALPPELFIEQRAFSRSDLTSVVIPASVKMLGDGCFEYCAAVASVTFDPGSALADIDCSAFERTSVHSVVVPRTVIFLGKRFSVDIDALGSLVVGSKSILKQAGE
jgi:hypothetical protein